VRRTGVAPWGIHGHDAGLATMVAATAKPGLDFQARGTAFMVFFFNLIISGLSMLLASFLAGFSLGRLSGAPLLKRRIRQTRVK
jgi:hypothetical protein